MNRPLLVALALLGMSACVGPFRDDFESHYADVSAARRAGAFDRGWLPEFIPDDAKDISEEHKIDSSRTWACFSTPAGPPTVRALLLKQGATRVPGPIASAPRGLLRTREWWPASMGEARLETYSLKESGGFTLNVGVDQAAGRVCFHRSARTS